MRNAQFEMLSGSDGGDVTGAAFFAGQWIAGSFVPVFGDASAAGAVKLQVSNYPPVGSAYKDFTPPASSWADIPNATSTITSGVGPAIVIGSMAFAYIRAIYTRNSGGSSTVKVYANVLSA
jgi:hypothetical protein